MKKEKSRQLGQEESVQKFPLRTTLAQKVWNTTDAVGGLFTLGLNEGNATATTNPTHGVGGLFISNLIEKERFNSLFQSHGAEVLGHV